MCRCCFFDPRDDGTRVDTFTCLISEINFFNIHTYYVYGIIIYYTTIF